MPHEPQKKYFLTTPIYYVNARPHIGHAYTTIVADVLARRHRLLGDDVFFLTGTDEHGQKIERSAAAAGIPPQQFADQVSAEFQKLWDRMGLTYDRYIRTTADCHKTGVQKLFRTLYQRGFIYLSSYTGAYCVSDEAFVDVPVGQPCPDCGRLTEQVTEENFFFKLSAFQAPLINLIETGVLAVEPESRRNEVLSFLRGNVNAATTFSSDTGIQPEAKYGNDCVDTSHSGLGGLDNGSSPAGASSEPWALSPGPSLANSDLGTPYVPGALKDLSISRSSFTWGIPVPAEVQKQAGATQNHVIYVWLDALANYMTALGYGSDTDASLTDEQREEAQRCFQHYWPADLQLVGKEIIRFHCVYWPAFLLAAGLPLPKAITAHGWLLFDNAKMSKSKGNIVRTETILEAFGALCPPVHQSLSSPPKAAPSSLSSLPEDDPSSLSSRPEADPCFLSSRPEAEGRSGEIPAFAAASAEGTSPGHGVAAGFSPRTSNDENEGALAPESPPQPLVDTTPRQGTASAVPFSAPSNRALAPEVSPSGPATRPPTPHERDLFASDVLRYFLLREIPFGQDGSFSFEALITRYNADLANGYGNLVSRTLAMIERSLAGVVPRSKERGKSVFQIALRKVPKGMFVGHPTDIGPFLSTEDFELARIAAVADFFQARSFEELRFSMGMAFDPVLSALRSNDAVPELQYGVLDYVALLVGKTDEFISTHKPWHLAKQECEESREELNDVLYTAAESIRIITALLYPILPYATARVWAQLGLGDIEAAARNGELKNLQWGGLQPGTKLGPLAPIFPRADKGLAQTMTDLENQSSSSLTSSKLDAERSRSELDSSQLTAHSGPARPEAPLKQAFTPTAAAPVSDDPTNPAAPPAALDGPSGTLPVAGSTAHTTGPDATPSHSQAPASGIFAQQPSGLSTLGSEPSPQITIDDFAKVELRVAEIKVCERIPKADKLLRLEVDLGHETRQILSGIAEFYTPEDLLGRRIIVITNLAPRKMRGLDSHGMLLAASGPEEGGKPGKPILATVPEGVPLGSRLK